MKLPLYQIDAFADKPFEGNPAAVVPLDAWLAEETMQAIAEENNLAETAFFVPAADGFHIRWFTPRKEVALCGHATLASAFVLFELLGYERESIQFDSQSGPLAVTKDGDLLTLNFPANVPVKCDAPDELVKGLGRAPVECYRNDDYVAVFENEQAVLAIEPDHRYLGAPSKAQAQGKLYDTEVDNGNCAVVSRGCKSHPGKVGPHPEASLGPSAATLGVKRRQQVSRPR